MNKFSAAVFVNLGASLHWFQTAPKTQPWNQTCKTTGEEFCGKIHDDLQAIGCDVSAKAVRRFGRDLPIPGVSDTAEEIAAITPRAREVRSVIFDDMSKHLFLWVPPERARLYEFPEDKTKWNDDEKALDGPISTHFKRAANEMLAARKAYAVGQFTPCVFHLMRACEVGIKALHKSLAQPLPKLADSWGNLLRPMDEQLTLPVPKRHGEWAVYPDFFDHATNDVRAIKRTWRDTTMHIDSDYNEGQSLKVLDAVTSFFVHLSEKLDQDGATH